MYGLRCFAASRKIALLRFSKKLKFRTCKFVRTQSPIAQLPSQTMRVKIKNQ